MSGSSPPPDNSAQVEMMREQSQREAQAAQDAKDLAHKQELSGMRDTARQGATGSVNNYFSSKGLDPTAYGGSIEQQLSDIASGISPTDENPGSAYKGAGQTIWDNLQTAGRSQAGTALDKVFSPNYATTRAPTTLDDTYWQGLEGEQYSSADNIIRNMLDRGVLTSSGYATAKADLDNQRAGVRSTLNNTGDQLVGKEQGSLNDIINRARSDAGNLTLGSSFDPSTYSKEADTSFNTFLSGLGDQIRAANPGQLFKTAGLAAIGGAGQGAGNTAFNPAAAAGVADDGTTDDTNKDQNQNSIF